ncbi:MAG: biopolymer transporter ExbD [Bacteroidetes bacterium]|jgi:biopolymer transport protein ExbD|nr:biopolymer transporter ExbD [Bacteroidota bacterium]
MPLDFSPSRKPLSTFSLAGMTDIVLLLLIFFLLTSNFIPQMGIQVTLPQVESSAPVDRDYVTVVLTDEGTYFVNGQRVSESRLVAAIRETRTTQSALVLRADEGATIGQFATVASAAQALNLRVLMATERNRR